MGDARRGPGRSARPVPGPGVRPGGFLDHLLRGKPPAVHPLDHFVRYGFLVVALLGLVAIVVGAGTRTPGLLVLMAPAGVLTGAIGLLTATNFRGVRDRMRERELHSLMYRLTKKQSTTAFSGVMLLLIGTGWVVLGVSFLR